MKKRTARKSESGVALVTALGILMVVSLLAASAVVLSQYAERDAYTFSSFTRSAYVAEGVANRVYWLILNDRKKYPQRNIDNSDDALQVNEERYLADGVPRQFEDYYGEAIRYKIHDAIGGLDISGNMPQRELSMLINNLPEGSPDRRELEILGDRLQDYADSDSLLKLNGMEKAEYLQQNLLNLPRNRPMQYREEVFLIPGNEIFFKPDDSGRLSLVRLIAPKGVSPIGGRPSLYSTPVSQIASRCRLTDLETANLEQAFREFSLNHTPLKDSLPPGFLKKLEMYFSIAESGFYTILIDTSTEQQPGLRLAVTFHSQFGNLQRRAFYEYMLY